MLSSSSVFHSAAGPGFDIIKYQHSSKPSRLAVMLSQMLQHYKAGYYLIRTKPINFGADKDKVVLTCSRCINTSVFDQWCLRWTNEKLDKKEKSALGLTDEKINEIQKWTDSRFDNGANVFPDLNTACEFKDLFFNKRQDIKIYSLNFPVTDAELLIEEFAEGTNKDFNYNNGNFELRHNLIKRTKEVANENEDFVGYDFIGVECDGSFHSFYCHDITKTLVDKFDLKLNEYGLFDEVQNTDLIRKYLNDNETGLEPVPWYIAKVKRVKDACR